MIVEQSKQIISEVNKAFIGRNDIVEKVLMTIYAGGHVLLEDCPGVGKTTLAIAFSHALGLSSKRIQFTPDTFRRLTAKQINLNIGRGRRIVSFCWRMKSTVPLRKRSLRCWRLWRSIPLR